MMKKSVIVLVVFLLVISVFSIAQTEEEVVEESFQDCNLGCKVWQFLFGNPANRAGKGWFDRGLYWVGQDQPALATGMGIMACSNKDPNSPKGTCNYQGNVVWFESGKFYPVTGKHETGPTVNMNKGTPYGNDFPKGTKFITVSEYNKIKTDTTQNQIDWAPSPVGPPSVGSCNGFVNSKTSGLCQHPEHGEVNYDASTDEFYTVSTSVHQNQPGHKSKVGTGKELDEMYCPECHQGTAAKAKQETAAEEAKADKEAKEAEEKDEGDEYDISIVKGLPKDYKVYEGTKGTWNCKDDLCTCISDTCTTSTNQPAKKGDELYRLMIANPSDGSGSPPKSAAEAKAQGWTCTDSTGGSQCTDPKTGYGFSYVLPAEDASSDTSSSKETSVDYTYGNWKCQTGGGCSCQDVAGCTDKNGVFVAYETTYDSEYVLKSGTSESDYSSSSKPEAQQVTDQKITVPQGAKSGQDLFGSSAACKDCKYWKDEKGNYYKVDKDGEVYVLNDEQKKQLASKGDKLPTIKTSKPSFVDKATSDIIDAAKNLKNKESAKDYFSEEILKKYDKQIEWDKAGITKEGNFVLPLNDKHSNIVATKADSKGMQTINYNFKNEKGEINPEKSKEQILSNQQTVAEQTAAQKESGVMQFIGTGNKGRELQTVNAVDTDAWEKLKNGEEIEYFGTETSTKGGFLGFGKNAKEVTKVTKNVAGKLQLENGVATNTNYLDERQVKVDTKTGEMFDNDGNYDKKEGTFTPTSGFISDPYGNNFIVEHEYKGPVNYKSNLIDHSTGFNIGNIRYDDSGNMKWQVVNNGDGTVTLKNNNGQYSKPISEDNLNAMSGFLQGDPTYVAAKPPSQKSLVDYGGISSGSTSAGKKEKAAAAPIKMKDPNTGKIVPFIPQSNGDYKGTATDVDVPGHGKVDSVTTTIRMVNGEPQVVKIEGCKGFCMTACDNAAACKDEVKEMGQEDEMEAQLAEFKKKHDENTKTAGAAEPLTSEEDAAAATSDSLKKPEIEDATQQTVLVQPPITVSATSPVGVAIEDKTESSVTLKYSYGANTNLRASQAVAGVVSDATTNPEKYNVKIGGQDAVLVDGEYYASDDVIEGIVLPGKERIQMTEDTDITVETKPVETVVKGETETEEDETKPSGPIDLEELAEDVEDSKPSGFQTALASIYVISDQMKNYPALNNLMYGDQEWYKDWKGWADRTFAPMLGTNWFPSAICEGKRKDMVPEGKAMIKTVSGTYQAVASIQMERSDRKTPLLCYINPNPESSGEFVCDKGQVCVDNFCYKDIDKNGEADDETVLEGYFYKISWGVSAPRDESFTPYVDENGISVSFNIWIDGNANDKVDAGAKYMYYETGNVAGPIELKNSAMDQDVIIKYSDNLYKEVCIKWDKAPVTAQGQFSAIAGLNSISNVCFEAQEIEVGSVKYDGGSSDETKSTSVSSGDVTSNSQW